MNRALLRAVHDNLRGWIEQARIDRDIKLEDKVDLIMANLADMAKALAEPEK